MLCFTLLLQVVTWGTVSQLTVKQREWEKPPPSLKGAHTRSGFFCLRWPEKSHKTAECEVGHCDRLDVHVICLYITHLWIFKSHFQQLINEFLIIFIHFIVATTDTCPGEATSYWGFMLFCTFPPVNFDGFTTDTQESTESLNWRYYSLCWGYDCYSLTD